MMRDPRRTPVQAASPARQAVLDGAGLPLRVGARIRLQPRRGADIIDLALAGLSATVDAIEVDFEQRVHVAVTVDLDPGRDLGAQRLPGHRFFFAPEEVLALADDGVAT